MNPGWGRIVAIAAAVMLTASPSAFAQVPPGDLPGRERGRFEVPEGPRAQPGGSAIKLPSTVAPPGAEKVILILRDVRITGSTVYGAGELASLYADLIGKTITLAQVYDIAARITAKYGKDGYVLSRAIVPPQEMNPRDAHVVLQIVEGYIDRVEWPASLSAYRDFFSYYAQKIIADRPANIRTMERYLLLAGDLPGLKFKNSLKASPNQQGAATLVVEVVAKPIDALSRVDNRGTQARGPNQFLASGTLNNVLHMHEALTISYAGAFPLQELQYVGLNYRQVLNGEGLTAFVNASYSWGRPGAPIDPLLLYKTKSKFAEAGVSYPFIRLRERNLIGSALFFASNDDGSYLDLPNDPPSTKDRLRGLRGRLDGDFTDDLKGLNQFTVTLSQGIRGLGSSVNGSDLLIPANGRVDFSKAELYVSRLQPLVGPLTLLAAAYGQYTGTPLLSPELCGYGGRVFGRAFQPSQMVADQCLLLLGELRADFPPLPGLQEITQSQLYGFVDRGWLHNLAPVVGTPSHLDGASVGGGIRLGWQPSVTPYGGLSADLSVAKAIEGPRDDWRFYFIVTGRY